MYGRRGAGGGVTRGLKTGEGLKAPPFAQTTGPNKRRLQCRKSFKALGLAVSALALTCLPAAAQTKVTNEGISAAEIVIGTHQDLSGPIKVWGRSGFPTA